MTDLKMALTVKEQRAALGGISAPTYYRLIQSGHLRTFLIGKRRYATPEAIRECIAKLEAECEDTGKIRPWLNDPYHSKPKAAGDE